MSQMLAVAPAICEEVSRTDGQDGPFPFPRRAVGNHHLPPVPAHFITRGRSVILPGHFQRVSEEPHGLLSVAPIGHTFAPGGQQFQAERYHDLVAPVLVTRLEPSILQTEALAVETELPRPIQVKPVKTLDQPALAVRPGIFRARINES